MWWFELTDKSFGSKTKVEGFSLPFSGPMGIFPGKSQIIVVDYDGIASVQNFKLPQTKAARKRKKGVCFSSP